MPDCPVKRKDTLDKRLISIDYATWLAASAANIATVAWAVPSGITAADEAKTSSLASNYFSGGTDGKDYEIACTITTDEAVPRLKTQRFLLRVLNGCS
jgi:hypothetical protein